jgi:hypothetical protein
MIPMLALAALLAASQAAPEAKSPYGTVKIFTDWAVTCDNVRTCEATGLFPNGPEPELGAPDLLHIVLRREGTADAKVQLEIRFYDPPPPRLDGLALKVDGQQVQTIGRATGDTTHITLAPRAVAAMLRGKVIQLDHKGEVIADGSLSGLGAALRYMDALQQRAGGRTALVATGPGGPPPAPPAIPMIHMSSPPAKRVDVSDAEAAKLRERVCDDGINDSDNSADAHALSPDATVLILSCGTGAYNLPAVVMLRIGKGRFQVADLEGTKHSPNEKGISELANVEWDGQTGLLSDDDKARGPGDCGMSHQWAWDGKRFRLVERREMPDCRESIDWLRTWQATVIRR